MKLEDLKYYINEYKPTEIWLNIINWKEICNEIGYTPTNTNYFNINKIPVIINVHAKNNIANFNYYTNKDVYYTNKDIEILNENERIIKNIIE